MLSWRRLKVPWLRRIGMLRILYVLGAPKVLNKQKMTIQSVNVLRSQRQRNKMKF